MASPVHSEMPSYLSQPPLVHYSAWSDDGPGNDEHQRPKPDELRVTHTNGHRRSKEREYTLLTKCIAEFLGDFTFVFVGTMQAYVPGKNPDDITHAALAHGFTIFILVCALGHISGGHFNPAVSWSIAASMRMPFWHFPFYMASQLLGGFCGALFSAVLQMHVNKPPSLNINEILKGMEVMGNAFTNVQFEFNQTAIEVILSSSQLKTTYAGATLLNPGSQWWEGLISETFATAFLCHTILLTAVDTDKNVLAPLAIGLTLSIDIFSVGSITGASMNPARSLGPNIVGSIFLNKRDWPPNFWNFHYIYWAGPFVGASIAAFIYRLFEAREDRLVP